MYIYIYICVCVYVCVYMCIYVCMICIYACQDMKHQPPRLAPATQTSACSALLFGSISALFKGETWPQ